MNNSKELLKEYPALEAVIDRVRVVNATVSSAELVEDGDGLALHLEFTLCGGVIRYTLSTMDDISKFFEVVGVTSLKRLPGMHVRVEYMTQASWTPFFRVSHIVKPVSYLFAYRMESLRRHARGERA